MKLRLRCLGSGETFKIEVPKEYNLQQLKETLIISLSSSSSSNASLHFSLNKKDELLPSSVQDSLHSLGITAGDLIYFTQNPDRFSSSPHQTQQEMQVLDVTGEPPSSKEMDISQELEVRSGTIDRATKNQLSGIVESMDVDTGCVDVGVKQREMPSEPLFLRRVLREEEFGDDFSDAKLMFAAVHAVFLQCGFVGFDSVSGLRVDLFHILQEQRSMNFTTSVCYTLPELLDNDDDNLTDSVVLKFQTLGQFVCVYGSLLNSPSMMCKSHLDKGRFVPAIGSIYCDENDRVCENDLYVAKVVLELWRSVKDDLALPLLTELCERNGLIPPPSLTRMPPEIKLKILESLPGIDVARMECVNKEMRNLSCNNNDLWKQKYTEEFVSGTAAPAPFPTTNWKRKFVSLWDERKKKQARTQFTGPRMISFISAHLGGRGNAYPFGQPAGVLPPHQARRNNILMEQTLMQRRHHLERFRA